MPKLSSLATDPALERGGVWHDYEGIRVLLARAHTPAFNAAAREFLAPHRDTVRENPNSEESAELVKQGALVATAKHVLLGWENLEEDDGAPIPWSEEKALEILSDDRYHDFREWVLGVSAQREHYRLKQHEDAAGN